MRKLGIALMMGAAPLAAAGQAELVGAWTATAAERNGAAAPDLIGHRLVFTATTFSIAAPDGKQLYAGTYTVDPAAQPARRA